MRFTGGQQLERGAGVEVEAVHEFDGDAERCVVPALTRDRAGDRRDVLTPAFDDGRGVRRMPRRFGYSIAMGACVRWAVVGMISTTGDRAA